MVNYNEPIFLKTDRTEIIDEVLKGKKDKKLMGKKSKAAGGRFELKVRKDLESKGWIVSKWMNNVDIAWEEKKGDKIIVDIVNKVYGKLIPAKHKFRGPGIPMAIGTGFPDFIAFKFMVRKMPKTFKLMNDYDKYQVIGIESKMNGTLDKIEKEKCEWLLENKIFSKILIASKGEKRGEIIYIEYQ